MTTGSPAYFDSSTNKFLYGADVQIPQVDMVADSGILPENTAWSDVPSKSVTGLNTQANALQQRTNWIRANQPVVVTNVSAIRALDKTKISYAVTKGYYTAGDGGAGEYWYDSSDTTSSDNGGTVIVASDGGRWKLNHLGGNINVLLFGAKFNSTGDDSTAINKAIDYVFSSGGGIIDLPSGIAYISSSIKVKAGCHLQGSGRASTILQPSGSFNAVEVHGNSMSNWLYGAKVSGLTVDGSRGCIGNALSIKYAGLRCNFFDLYLRSMTGIGLRIEGSFDHCYSNIECRENSSYGVQVYEKQPIIDGVYEEVSFLRFYDVHSIGNNSGGVQWDQAGGDNCEFWIKPSEGSVGIDLSRNQTCHKFWSVFYDSLNTGSGVAIRTSSEWVNQIVINSVYAYNGSAAVQVDRGQNIYCKNVFLNNTSIGVTIGSSADGPVYIEQTNVPYTDSRTTPQTYTSIKNGSWTPVWSGSSPTGSLGNGTLQGVYSVEKRVVTFQITLTLGSTSVAPGYGMSLSLPMPPVSGTSFQCSVLAYDSSAATYYSDVGIIESAWIALPRGAGYYGGAAVVPFAWATGDTLKITGTYLIS